MSHPIDNTLALLRDVMSEHRRALTSGPALRPPLHVVLPQDRRGQLINQLLGAVERRTGIEVAQPAAEKLVRVFASIDIVEFGAWVARLESLPTGHPQWSMLIESLTVHETYVMRDASQLELFAAQLPGMIAEAAAAKRYLLRFWSLGCATGEEAYSIAALAFDALIAAGKALKADAGADLVSPWRIEILGSDISSAVLAKARAGIYDVGPLSSFRAESTPLLRYFPPVPKAGGQAARAVSAALAAAVHFERFNIMEDPMPAPPFDAVFCRNVLIYFSAPARRRAQQRLHEAVRPGGYLLLGPTDSLTDAQAFETLWASDAVIHRRRAGDV